MNVRYAPGALKRIKEYQADLRLRIKAEVLTEEEAATLLAQRMREEAEGAEAKRVRCPDCRAEERIVGVGQKWACRCSPNTVRSVWDCRVNGSK